MAIFFKFTYSLNTKENAKTKIHITQQIFVKFEVSNFSFIKPKKSYCFPLEIMFSSGNHEYQEDPTK